MQLRKIDYTEGKNIYGSETVSGKIIKSPRLFGVEFEMVPDATSSDRAREIHQRTVPPTAWGIAHDGSILSPVGGGVEIQTPPMRQSKGEVDIINFCTHAKSAGWTVNKSCGVHVHHNAKDIIESPKLVKRVFLAYFVMDYSILAMLPEDRRNNQYCAPLENRKAKMLLRHSGTGYEKGFKLDDIVAARPTKKDFLEMMYKTEYENIPREISSHYNEARYHGINFHNLYGSIGTIEVRYLQGTLDSDLILHWIALHQHIIDSSSKLREVDSLELYNIKGPKTRLRAFAVKTGMPKYLLDFGCTLIDKHRKK
jgi:hypothetical protein